MIIYYTKTVLPDLGNSGFKYQIESKSADSARKHLFITTKIRITRELYAYWLLYYPYKELVLQDVTKERQATINSRRQPKARIYETRKKREPKPQSM